MGTPEFAVPVLESLWRAEYDVVACVTQPDKPIGRHMKLSPPPVKQFAENHHILCSQPASVRPDLFIEQMTNWEPDLIITAAYGKILPQAILDIPKLGCLNVHASLLPKYRGAAPVHWAIMQGETKTGVTIMKTDAGMDTGAILTKAEIELDPNIHTPQLTVALSELGANLLLTTIPEYLSGACKPRPQDEQTATCFPMIRKEQGEINWHQSARQIHNQIRALSAWPGAYTYLNGERFKIYRSEVATEALAGKGEEIQASLPREPGKIAFVDKKNMAVACGEGYLFLTCVQPASSRKMDIAECAHNYHIGLVFSGEEV